MELNNSLSSFILISHLTHYQLTELNDISFLLSGKNNYVKYFSVIT